MNRMLKGIIMPLVVFMMIISNVTQCFALVTSDNIYDFPGGKVLCYISLSSLFFGDCVDVYVKEADKGITEFTNMFTFLEGENEIILADAFADCTELKLVDLYGFDGNIASSAFKNCTGLEKVVIYSTTSFISEYAFEGCDKDKLVIYCEKDSVAESFAKQYGYKYRIITQAPLNELEDKVFDVETYKANNPDVVAKFGSDENVLYNHWIQTGISEGRKGSKIFDAEYYIENNADVKQLCGNDYVMAYEHYINIGYNAGKAAIAPGVYGDVTGDGRINIEDVSTLMQYVLKPEACSYAQRIKENFEYCDVNADNRIDTVDVGMILQKVLDSSYQFNA